MPPGVVRERPKICRSRKLLDLEEFRTAEAARRLIPGQRAPGVLSQEPRQGAGQILGTAGQSFTGRLIPRIRVDRFEDGTL